MLQIVHLELSESNKLVRDLHRHHKPVVGHRFSIGACSDGQLVGAAICGRPVARMTDYRKVLEVTRLVTDGTKNACSFLYSASARAARELGYSTIQTFILETESGASLVAAGWEMGEKTKGDPRRWHTRSGRRNDQPEIPKVRYFKRLR